MWRRLVIVLVFALASGWTAQSSSVAQACPMCKVATEADANLPRAYMYSILFMLAMPATIFTGFGIGLYRLNRKESADLAAAQQSTSEDSNEPPLAV